MKELNTLKVTVEIMLIFESLKYTCMIGHI